MVPGGRLLSDGVGDRGLELEDCWYQTPETAGIKLWELMVSNLETVGIKLGNCWYQTWTLLVSKCQLWLVFRFPDERPLSDGVGGRGLELEDCWYQAVETVGIKFGNCWCQTVETVGIKFGNC